jgi:mutator family transposase
MPSKRKKADGPDRVFEVKVPPELVDQVVKGPMTADEVQTVCRSLKKAIIERAMGADISQHLGYAPGDAEPAGRASHRNGTSGKTVLTDNGPVLCRSDLESNFEIGSSYSIDGRTDGPCRVAAPPHDAWRYHSSLWSPDPKSWNEANAVTS